VKEQLELTGYNVTKSLRIDEEDAKELQKIALFEKARPGTLLRMWIHDKVETYRRNPEYKRWDKQRSLISLKESKKR